MFGRYVKSEGTQQINGIGSFIIFSELQNFQNILSSETEIDFTW